MGTLPKAILAVFQGNKVSISIAPSKAQNSKILLSTGEHCTVSCIKLPGRIEKIYSVVLTEGSGVMALQWPKFMENMQIKKK